MTEQLSPVEVTSFATRFYETGSRALLPHGALLGQVAGDQVEAIFVPGLATAEYRRGAPRAPPGPAVGPRRGEARGGWGSGGTWPPARLGGRGGRACGG